MQIRVPGAGNMWSVVFLGMWFGFQGLLDEGFPPSDPNTADAEMRDEFMEYINYRVRVGQEHGVTFILEKGLGRACPHDILIAPRGSGHVVVGYDKEGKHAVSGPPEVLLLATGKSPEFPIPQRVGVWSVTEKWIRTTDVQRLGDVLLLIIRSRNGSIRVVDMDNARTLWIPVKESPDEDNPPVLDGDARPRGGKHQRGQASLMFFPRP
jgi:hypothetical protein